MSKYIDLSSDSSEDTSLDGFIVRDKKHKKHNEHKPHKKHLKRKRSESLDQDSQESLESQESIDQDDDFESPVSSLLVNLGRYFDIDKSAARMQIAKQIQINLPQLPPDRTKQLTKSILDHINSKYLSVNSGVKPSDKGWRIGLSRIEVETLKPILKKIRESIKQKMPTIPKILSASVPFSNKVIALQWFDVLQNDPPYTEIWLEHIKKINRMIKQDPNITTDQLAEMDATEARLERITPDHDQEFKDKIYQLHTSDRIKSIILGMYNEMLYLSDNTQEHARKKLDYMVKLPYQRKKVPIELGLDQEENRITIAKFLTQVRSRLDERLYGMDEIKNKVVNMIHNRLFSSKSHSILCLKGPPGVGKTALASAIAYASEVPFDKIAAAGMTDPTAFKGSDEVWIGSQPSLIIRSLCKIGYNNPVILVDELDKANDGYKGNVVQNALFEVLDIEQNSFAKDLYLHEFEHDFSNILWVISVNDTDKLHPAIKSRLDIIEVEPYSREQLIQITRNYVLPSELLMAALTKDQITINDDAIDSLINRSKQDNDVDVRIIRNAIRSIVLSLNVMETYRRNPPEVIGVSKSGPTSLRFRIKRPRLAYDVKDFNGFPYEINQATVDKLVHAKKATVLSYYT
jgi:ATP-dependent Lon protease